MAKTFQQMLDEKNVAFEKELAEETTRLEGNLSKHLQTSLALAFERAREKKNETV